MKCPGGCVSSRPPCRRKRNLFARLSARTSVSSLLRIHILNGNLFQGRACLKCPPEVGTQRHERPVACSTVGRFLGGPRGGPLMRYGAVAALAAQFPPLETAHPDGFLCLGGDLRPERLLAAYSRGIFPWYEEGLPVLWWSPDPRCVLPLEAFHLPGAAPGPCAAGRLPLPWTGLLDGSSDPAPHRAPPRPEPGSSRR